MSISKLSTRQLDRLAIAAVLAMGLAIALGGMIAVVIPILVIGFVAMLFVPVDVWMSAAVALTIFSGNSSLMGLPIPPARVLFAISLFMLIIGAPLNNDRDRVVSLRGVHVALLAASVYAAASAYWAGTLFEERALYELVDRFGFVPFLMFTLGPIVYGTVRARRVLLSFLTGTGFYLAVVGWLEAFDQRDLVWPSYINDPNVGLHFERARGPFVEGTGMGTGLFVCAVAALIGMSYFRTAGARRFAKFTAFACLAATVFTLTRSIWLGTALAVAVTMLSDTRLRKAFLPLAAVSAVAVVIALATVPQVQESFDQRASQQETVWDRVNLNAGAVNAFQTEPVTGIGWGNWVKQSADYLELQPGFPITGVGFEVHSLFLSHLAQLGAIGVGLYIVAIGLAVLSPISRKAPPTMKFWRLGLLAISVQWLIVIALTPGSFQFGTLVLWLFAGICSKEWISRPADTGRSVLLRPAKGELVGSP